MIAILDGETRPILRHRRGVIWCPFCDRSTQYEGADRWCDGCRAKFTDEVSEAETPAAPRRGRKTTEASPEEAVEVDGEVADVL